MKIVISNKQYNMKNGIGLLKTLYENDYNAIPESFKHNDIKAEWDCYDGISKKLYTMSQSNDHETLQLCIEILKQEKILHDAQYYNKWSGAGQYVKEIRSITVFQTL